MPKLFGLLAGASVVALAFPSAFERYRAELLGEAQIEMVQPPSPVIEASAEPRSSDVRLRVDPDGHFRGSARINGHPEPILIDTGATYVSLGEATAKRLGLRLLAGDFRGTAQTAAGSVAAALVRLDRVQVGSLEVRDVEAIVLKGSSETTLLGMSFLARLESVEMRNGELILKR